MNEGSAMRPLSETLGLVADEIADLALLGDRLQALISRLALASGDIDMATMQEAQGADLLSQRLSGLASFVQVLTSSTPASATADVAPALAALTLSDQVRQLSGAASAAAEETAGELMFWD